MCLYREEILFCSKLKNVRYVGFLFVCVIQGNIFYPDNIYILHHFVPWCRFRLRMKVESILWVTSDEDISFLVYSTGRVYFFI
jgi:hypothetical protein